MESGDLSPPDLRSETTGYRFEGTGLSEEAWREAYQNWILSKGFQDLARGVRETMEEALLYIAITKLPRPTTLGQFQAERAAVLKLANRLQFPDLLRKVNAGLSTPLTFEAEFRSLQNVRNCLEHRGGRVGTQDADPTTGKMTLRFPRLRTIYRRGEEEVEILPGTEIDAREEEVPVYLQIVPSLREYGLGERVVISAADFAEVAMACHFFAGEVASKLPTLSQPAA